MRSSVSASGGLLVRSPARSGAADGPKMRAPSGRGAEKAGEQVDDVGVRLRHLDAVACERDGEAGELGPRQPAQAAVRGLEPGGDARHGARPRTDEERLAAGAEVDDVRLERRHGRRCGPNRARR